MEFTSRFAPSVTLAAYPGGHQSWHSDKPSALSLTNYWFSPHFKAGNNKLLNALHPSISLSGEIPVCNTGSKGALPSLRPWWVDEALRFMYFVLLPSNQGLVTRGDFCTECDFQIHSRTQWDIHTNIQVHIYTIDWTWNVEGVQQKMGLRACLPQYYIKRQTQFSMRHALNELQIAGYKKTLTLPWRNKMFKMIWIHWGPSS